jgi:hypothetical protein
LIKGEKLTPPFEKACLPVGREGWEGFKKAFFKQLKKLRG